MGGVIGQEGAADVMEVVGIWANIVKVPEDEAAAMAAMFQAQTANWEETQEKMSQLVSRPRAIFCLRSIYRSNELRFTPLLVRNVRIVR